MSQSVLVGGLQHVHFLRLAAGLASRIPKGNPALPRALQSTLATPFKFVPEPPPCHHPLSRSTRLPWVPEVGKTSTFDPPEQSVQNSESAHWLCTQKTWGRPAWEPQVDSRPGLSLSRRRDGDYQLLAHLEGRSDSPCAHWGSLWENYRRKPGDRCGAFDMQKRTGVESKLPLISS